MKEEIVICPYCQEPARWCENKEVYGRNYGNSYMCYYCRPCDAYVGCHNNTRKPLGMMANKELRNWRKKVHAYIDPYWKDGTMTRGELYKCISWEFGRVMHVGEANIEECKKILTIDIMENYKAAFDY